MNTCMYTAGPPNFTIHRYRLPKSVTTLYFTQSCINVTQILWRGLMSSISYSRKHFDLMWMIAQSRVTKSDNTPLQVTKIRYLSLYLSWCVISSVSSILYPRKHFAFMWAAAHIFSGSPNPTTHHYRLPKSVTPLCFTHSGFNISQIHSGDV